MPARIKIVLLLLVFSLSVPGSSPAYEPPTAPAPRPFRFASDTFSFANETVWNYVGGTVQAETAKTKKREYTRRCFVVARAAVQFWKFARFDPKARPLAPDQLAARIRQVTGRSVWLPTFSNAQRIVFPGYPDLHAISLAKPEVFQANIGEGWPVYFRPGNQPITDPVTRSMEDRLHRQIDQDLQNNYPTIVWLYRFPSLKINHVVVVFAEEKDSRGVHYQVYDPNYSDSPKRLEYNAATRTFSYEPTFYFKGGPVNARAIYRGVFE